jgi:glyceraldehyde-3-phosphate dehydrogenase/erythrose-4-phosphate dehydrogenase
LETRIRRFATALISAVAGGRYLRTPNWYDNERGYSSRVSDLLAQIGQWGE